MQEKCIFIYDDDHEILKICKLILADEYSHVKTFTSCENLFEDIEQLNPHLILMDLWMPEMDGALAVESLRANEKTKNIPVVVFSAVNDIETISEKINATALIRKPFSIEDMRETVKKHIS